MSRNFTVDQILADRLVINDTEAFEEIYYRYWYSLYFYGLRKLHSPEDSKHLVLTIFNALWQKRHFLPASFTLAKELYEEGKKEIVKRLSQKLVGVSNLELVETGITADLITSSDEQLEIYNSIEPELTIQQQPKLVRYINGQTIPAEQWQIQDWPSDTKPNTYLSPREKRNLEKEILLEIQSLTAYLLLFPKKEIPWWQKIAAMF
jgi:hypothetical protein